MQIKAEIFLCWRAAKAVLACLGQAPSYQSTLALFCLRASPRPLVPASIGWVLFQQFQPHVRPRQAQLGHSEQRLDRLAGDEKPRPLDVRDRLVVESGQAAKAHEAQAGGAAPLPDQITE